MYLVVYKFYSHVSDSLGRTTLHIIGILESEKLWTDSFLTDTTSLYH